MTTQNKSNSGQWQGYPTKGSHQTILLPPMVQQQALLAWQDGLMLVLLPIYTLLALYALHQACMDRQLMQSSMHASTKLLLHPTD